MKLSARQTAQAANQTGARPIPDSHPAMSQLIEVYGEHTFFLDEEGLEIVEPESGEDGLTMAKVVKLASWSDPQHTSLMTHDPEPTDIEVELEAEEPGRRH